MANSQEQQPASNANDIVSEPLAEGAERRYQFEVAMSCTGCSGAVERALAKQEGVKKVKTDLSTQLVTVDAADPATLDVVQAKIEKTGKAIKSSTQVLPLLAST